VEEQRERRQGDRPLGNAREAQQRDEAEQAGATSTTTDSWLR
jgi:hypothetical protein